jgi:hypothetical protein
MLVGGRLRPLSRLSRICGCGSFNPYRVAGYFDEAMGGSGPQGHGLARFTPDLSPDWLYPVGAGLPPVCDCYTLNVHAERAYICPYTDFHLISVADGEATDLGQLLTVRRTAF